MTAGQKVVGLISFVGSYLFFHQAPHDMLNIESFLFHCQALKFIIFLYQPIRDVFCSLTLRIVAKEQDLKNSAFGNHHFLVFVYATNLRSSLLSKNAFTLCTGKSQSYKKKLSRRNCSCVINLSAVLAL